VPIAGGNVVTMASGQTTPFGIAQDAKAVYWSTQAGGTIMMVAK
jgi:hypothetical protein